MNHLQQAAARALTDRVVQTYRFDGSWSFKVEQVGDQIMLSGSNANDLKWFEESRLLLAFIGPRGA